MRRALSRQIVSKMHFFVALTETHRDRGMEMEQTTSASKALLKPSTLSRCGTGPLCVVIFGTWSANQWSILSEFYTGQVDVVTRHNGILRLRCRDLVRGSLCDLV